MYLNVHTSVHLDIHKYNCTYVYVCVYVYVFIFIYNCGLFCAVGCTFFNKLHFKVECVFIVRLYNMLYTYIHTNTFVHVVSIRVYGRCLTKVPVDLFVFMNLLQFCMYVHMYVCM